MNSIIIVGHIIRNGTNRPTIFLGNYFDKDLKVHVI